VGGRSKTLAFLAGLLISVTLVGGLSVPASVAAPIRECGDMPSRFAYNITTRKAACWKAREVIRRWGNTLAQEGGDGHVGAYYCNYKNIGYEAGDIRCTASRGRVVHWQTGV